MSALEIILMGYAKTSWLWLPPILLSMTLLKEKEPKKAATFKRVLRKN